MKKITLLVMLLLVISSCSPKSQPSQDTKSSASSASTSSSASSSKLIPVIFDDDGSPDGTAALFFLLSHPRVAIEAVNISYGEAHPEEYIQHIGRKLDELGIDDMPLGAGQDGPVAGSNEFPEEMRQAAGSFWGLPIPNADKVYPVQKAPELMVSIINQAPEPVTIFVSGPNTNLAQALRLDPNIRDNIAAVYMMGGAIYVPGNIDGLLPNTDNSVAEWNIYADPQSAKEVFAAGLAIYLIPLDATNQVTVSRQDIRQWRRGGGNADFAADIYDMIFNKWGMKSADVWDLMTAAILAKPDLCNFRPLHLEVVTNEGANSGQTLVDTQGEANIQVCLEPDVAGIKQTLIGFFSSSE